MNNPYDAPRTVDESAVVAVAVISDAESIRRQHLGRETTLRQSLLCLLGLWLLLLCMASFHAHQSHWSDVTILVLIGGYVLPCAVLGLFVWPGVKGRRSWSRKPAMVFALLSLPLFPIGSAFAIQVLNALLTGPHPRLLTSDYRQLVLQTEKLSPRMSALGWLALVLLVFPAIAVVLVARIPQDIRHAR